MALNRSIPPNYQLVDKVSLPQIDVNSFDNGVSLFHVKGKASNIIKILFFFDAGYLYQDKALLANSTTFLLKSGSHNISANEINDKLDFYGVYFEPFTTFNKAGFEVYTLKEYFPQVIQLIKETVFQPNFPAKEFELFLQQSDQALQRKFEQVDFLATINFNNTLFGNESPFGRLITPNSYSSLKVNEVKDFHAQYYKSKTFKILTCGDIQQKEITLLNQIFGQDELQIKNKKNFLDISAKAASYRLIEKESAIQSALNIGTLFPDSSHHDYFKLKILNTIFGGYFGSRLMKKIREEKGYTYGIYSEIIPYNKFSVFKISTQVGVDNVQLTIDEIKNQIKELQCNLISSEELQLAKNYLMGKILKSFDNLFKRTTTYQGLLFRELGFEYYSKYISSINSCLSKDLIYLSKKYLDFEKFITIVAGKHK